MLLNVLFFIIILTLNILLFVKKIFTADLSKINSHYAPHPSYISKSTPDDVVAYSKYVKLVLNATNIPYAIITAINFISIPLLVLLNYSILDIEISESQSSFHIEFIVILFLGTSNFVYEIKRRKIINYEKTLIDKHPFSFKYADILLYWIINTILATYISTYLSLC